jgi:hypothetical protein
VSGDMIWDDFEDFARVPGLSNNCVASKVRYSPVLYGFGLRTWGVSATTPRTFAPALLVHRTSFRFGVVGLSILFGMVPTWL